MAVVTGVIADDFTGATDIASFMTEQGWRVALLPGMPEKAQRWDEDVNAIVISLKSRSLPASDAIRQAVDCCQWLQEQVGAKQIFFKYCSTFDSTPQGNIGPVSDALLAATRAPYIVHCPALPQNGRTVVHGHLFVNGVLLNESGMEKHPLNPMTDASIVRLLAAQTPAQIGRIDLKTIQADAAAITASLHQRQTAGDKHIIVDTLTPADLLNIARALQHAPLLAGGSGLGGALAAMAPTADNKPHAGVFPTAPRAVVLSGSCSSMTLRQVNAYKTRAAAMPLDIARCVAGDEHYIDHLTQWAMSHIADPLAPLLYATLAPEELKAVQQRYGEQLASQAVERTFARLALKLRDAGVNTFIVAGGETSGTVVEALHIKRLTVGRAIAPGVPWVFAAGNTVALALKSGNFGSDDFFFNAQEYAV